MKGSATSRSRQLWFPALVALAMLANLPQVQGSCDIPRVVSTLYPPGTYSYIVTPGLEATEVSSSVSEQVRGSFWALGSGDPLFQRGHDNGAFPAIVAPSSDGWLDASPGSGATIHTSWARTHLIDGCVDEVDIHVTCTALLLTDQIEARGYFAFATAAPVLGNYSFVQPNNERIVLAPIPRPNLVGAVDVGGTRQVTVAVNTRSEGLYLSPDCPGHVITGYRVYASRVARGAVAPLDRDRSATVERWRVLPGGEDEGGGAIPFAIDANVSVDCESQEDVYLATSLVFDSGFETFHVSENSDPIRCPQ